MNSHPFDNNFSLTPEHKAQFHRAGFVKLEQFFNSAVVDTLLDRVDAEMNRGTASSLKANSMFNRAKYDFETERSHVYELLERPYFQQAFTELVGHDLFLTFEVCFELEKNVSKGFPWHVGAQSFGYQVAEEFGYTVWAPLHPVDSKGQRGGMAYVPENLVSGDFVYRLESAIVETLKAKEKAGINTSVNEYFGMRTGTLNSQTMLEILEHNQVEDDFEPGDVLVFNKNVVHRSVMLGEGPLPRRAAHVMRFVDAASHYDLQRAKLLEFPEEQYGKGFFPYRPFTRQHIEIAEAGAQDRDLISECAYFDNRDKRTIRREHAS